MKSFSLRFGLFLALLVAIPAGAAGVEDVLGPWRMVTAMPQGEDTSTIVFSQDGATLKGEIQARGGSLPVEEPTFEDGVLSWGLKLPQLQGAIVVTTVTVEGDKFTGSVKTPIGELAVRGERATAEALEESASREEKLVGDWNLYTEFEGEPIISKMRLFMNDSEGDDQGLAGVLISRGGQLFIRRIRVDDDSISFRVVQPFVSDEPATVRARLDGTTFEGVIDSVYGEMKIIGEMIDTTKMVLAPYDDPSPVLGDWEGTAVIDGEEHAVSIHVYEEENRLQADISGDGVEFAADLVEYDQVSDTMGVLRLTVPVPDLGTEPQIFELIVDGNTIDGEELHSNGTRTLTGERKG